MEDSGEYSGCVSSLSSILHPLSSSWNSPPPRTGVVAQHLAGPEVENERFAVRPFDGDPAAVYDDRGEGLAADVEGPDGPAAAAVDRLELFALDAEHEL